MAAEYSSNPPAIPITLPPYPEMILAAISALNDPNGSNKSSILKQIESTYGEMPPSHATLVSHHLNEMKKSNQLALVKNNYLIPDPTSPKRGRGRPPKPKSANTPAVYTGPPRPRGRPPKVVDPNAPPPAPKVVASSGKGCGRPPKKAKTGGADMAVTGCVSGVKRGRGRPPKVKAAVEIEV